MVSMRDVKKGMVKFVDRELLPHLTGAKKVGLGIYAALAAENLESKLTQLKDHWAISMLGIVDKDNMVDIDKLYQAAVDQMSSNGKISMDLPVIGTLTLDRSDLDKLYYYIKE